MTVFHGHSFLIQMNLKRPEYFDLLTNNERDEYYVLKDLFFKNRCKHKDNDFSNDLERIHNWVHQEDSRAWVRSLVAGIVWLDKSILVSNTQIGILTSLKKSSLDFHFNKTGYVPETHKRVINSTVKDYFNGHVNFTTRQLKYWSLRSKPRRKHRIILIPPLRQIIKVHLIDMTIHDVTEHTHIDFNPQYDNHSIIDINEHYHEPTIELTEGQIEMLNSEVAHDYNVGSMSDVEIEL